MPSVRRITIAGFVLLLPTLIHVEPLRAETYANNHLRVWTETRPDFILVRYETTGPNPTHVNILHPYLGQMEGAKQGSFRIHALKRVERFRMQSCAKRIVASNCSKWFVYRHTIK
jgi:hypothetical protein